MKRWGVGLLVVLLACIPIFVNRGRGAGLLEDTDTSVLLRAIRARHAPLSWFAGDWPLENHFYRPLPTLTFEMDNALYRNNGSGYGVTNSLLAIASVLLLFWFLREFTNNPTISTLSAGLFAFWVAGDWAGWGSTAVEWIAYACFIGFVVSYFGWLLAKPGDEKRNHLKARMKFSLLAGMTLMYAAAEVEGGLVTAIGNLPSRMIQWLPGRTASVMAVFSLLAMAAYCRYERLSAEKIEKAPSAQDLPAGRSSSLPGSNKWVWIWAVLAVVGVALAFASYEQAVMVPAVLLGLAICMRMQGLRVRWGWQALFWLCLVGYLVLRKELLPAGVSHYQHQQLRFGPGVRLAIMGYVFPTWESLLSSLETLSLGIAVILSGAIIASVFAFATNLVAFIEARRRLVFCLAGWALSSVAFLPMAWVKPFEHYDFWPMAIRSVFAITLCWVGFELLISAVSLPALQAPPRQDPAPGSLPHQ